MFLRRLTWARLTKGGIPTLVVLRPLGGGFTPAFGQPFPIDDPTDKRRMTRVRQLYEQKRIGTQDELNLAIAKNSKLMPASAHAGNWDSEKESYGGSD